MNVQLFNFHAAGSSARESTLAQSNEYPEPPGSPASAVVSILWNKGCCTVPFALCPYGHRWNVSSGPHRAMACCNQSSMEVRQDLSRVLKLTVLNGFFSCHL